MDAKTSPFKKDIRVSITSALWIDLNNIMTSSKVCLLKVMNNARNNDGDKLEAAELVDKINAVSKLGR